MNSGKVIGINGPEETEDLVTEMARVGARQMLQVALEEEVAEFIELHSSLNFSPAFYCAAVCSESALSF